MAMTPSSIRLGDLSVSFALPLADAVHQLGHAPGPLLQQYGLTEERLGKAQARLSIPRYMRLGHAAIQLSGEPALGLHIGRFSELNRLGLAGITASQAPTAREAARILIRFEPLYASNYRGQSSLHEDEHGAWLRFYSISPYNDYNRFVVDSILSGWLTGLEQVSGRPIQTDAVEIEFDAPDYLEQYQERFGLTPAFAASHNQLYLNRKTLEQRNPRYCPGTWQHLLEICETTLEQLTRTHSLRERIIQLLGPQLQGHEPALESIARRLHLPSWTLRRKLAEEGTTFRAIVNDIRRDLALTYIRDTELAFSEIAYLLGFASAEAFQRAFRRWMAQTPGDYRRQQRRIRQS